jgi:hypothetical protein
MRSRAFNSSRKRGWFWRAKATAEEEDMMALPYKENRQKRV